MPPLSPRSLALLQTCHEDLQAIFIAVAEEYPCTVLCGYRGQSEQHGVYLLGRSKIDWLPGEPPPGKHNQTPSLAVDVVPDPVDWKNERAFYHFAGYVRAKADDMGLKIRWGGDWDGDKDLTDHSFLDLPHFELVEK